MRRTGFTLLELILVMVILVIAVSLVAPIVDSMMHPNQVRAATDVVRANWEQTRARAMEEGRPYRFSIVESGNTFRIEPDDADSNDEVGYEIEGELPEACLFVANGGGVIEPGATPSGSGSWKAIVVFLPDGTARDDAELSFGRPGLARVTLQLRALTGTVSQLKVEASR